MSEETDGENPEAGLLATRQAVQLWLLERPDACEEPDDLAALNLRVWAAAFLRTTRDEARDIEERLRDQGERSMARRVVESARAVLEIAPGEDTFGTLGRAFAVEAMRLDEQLMPWEPGGDGLI